MFSHRSLQRFLLSSVTILSINTFAATPINLAHQSVSMFNSISSSAVMNQTSLKEISREADRNQTLHVRVKQMYAGHEVWGGDAVVHIPHGAQVSSELPAVMAAASANHGFMNGTVYQNLQKDLIGVVPADISEQAVNTAITSFQSVTGNKNQPEQIVTKLIVYLDKQNKAHWAYHISFDVAPDAKHALPAKPNYILDAYTFATYEHWDNLQTENVKAGGFGGNAKTGKRIYDGAAGDLAAFDVHRSLGSCAMGNDDVTVYSRILHVFKVEERFGCSDLDPNHNNIYWDADKDAVNGGYSPANDAMFDGIVVKHLYQDWYGVPVLKQNNQPMMLTMIVHENMENAYWDGKEMVFGDGGSEFYPLTSLDVGAHEVSHGFTQQHSNLYYEYQSGGLNESFSDMASQAAEFYAFGHNSWMIGEDIFKSDGALRYMDKPSKDCTNTSDECSIDDASQYNDGLDVHHTSGVFNRAFYLIATAPGWDTRKAFDVMVQANSHYWTPNSTFIEAACGVLSAAKDLHYDQTGIQHAFATVKVDTSQCN